MHMHTSFKSGGMTFPRSHFAGVMSYSVNIDHVKSGYNQTFDTKCMTVTDYCDILYQVQGNYFFIYLLSGHTEDSLLMENHNNRDRMVTTCDT